AYSQTALCDLVRQLVRVMPRRARAINKTLDACLAVALNPFVTDPPADAEAPTHRRKRFLSSLDCHHKAHALIHRTGLRPSHRQGPACRSVDLLPMCPVYSVTHVPGLDHPNPLPLRGEGPQTPSFLAVITSARARGSL